MAADLTPMIHVPDVRATVEWYRSIDFTVIGTNEPDGEMDWAMLALGDGRVMFNEGGSRTGATRREVDLYVRVENVDALYQRLRARVDVHEGPHDTFYGMREFTIRDLNGFWITFGQQLDRHRTSPPTG